jgi:hypothetical protein
LSMLITQGAGRLNFAPAPRPIFSHVQASADFQY